jgi:hypothetical protein
MDEDAGGEHLRDAASEANRSLEEGRSDQAKLLLSHDTPRLATGWRDGSWQLEAQAHHGARPRSGGFWRRSHDAPRPCCALPLAC